MNDHQAWTHLASLVFSSWPKKVDAIFCHAWGDLHDKMIDFVGRSFRTTKANAVVLNGLKEYAYGKCDYVIAEAKTGLKHLRVNNP